MTRLILAFFLVFAAWPAASEDGDYLTSEALFSAAWDKLVERIGADANVLELSLAPTEVRVQVQAPQGGPRVDAWRVRRTRSLFGGRRDTVSGPDPVREMGPVGNVVSGFFPLATVPIERLRWVMAEAIERAGLLDEARIAEVRIARQIGILPRPSYGEVRWNISVVSDREQASAQATAEGLIIGVDISGTYRGRNKDFLTQPDWSFGAAGEGFRRLVAAETGVYEVSVSRLSVAVDATTEGQPKQVTTFSWDGGMFSRGLLDLPNIDAMRPGGNLPFSIEEIDFAAIPTIIANAQAQSPIADAVVRSMGATKEGGTLGPPEVLWRIALADKPRQMFATADDETIVQLKPDGTVVSVLLPKALRPPVNYVEGEALTDAVAQLASELGPTAVVFDMTFREDRASVDLSDPASPGQVTHLQLNDRGITVQSVMPMMIETDEDRFTLETLGSLDAATVEAIKAKAVEALAISGGKAYRMRFWNGAPFWRSPDGKPLIDVRVASQPGSIGGGYAVFQLDGTLVEAIK